MTIPTTITVDGDPACPCNLCRYERSETHNALDLEPIKARLAAATPGPWRVSTSSTDGPTICDFGLGDFEIAIPKDVESNPRGDAELVANAPTDLAALVAEVERLCGLLNRAWDVIPEGYTVLRDEIEATLG